MYLQLQEIESFSSSYYNSIDELHISIKLQNSSQFQLKMKLKYISYFDLRQTFTYVNSHTFTFFIIRYVPRAILIAVMSSSVQRKINVLFKTFRTRPPVVHLNACWFTGCVIKGLAILSQLSRLNAPQLLLHPTAEASLVIQCLGSLISG